jgi:hypothetical protein
MHGGLARIPPGDTRFARVSQATSALSLGGRSLGALNLSSRDTDGFSKLDEDLVALLTGPAAASIVVASRYAEARGLAAQLEQALRRRPVLRRIDRGP